MFNTYKRNISSMMLLPIILSILSLSPSVFAQQNYSSDVYFQGDGRIYDAIADKRWATMTETQGMSYLEVKNMLDDQDWNGWRIANKGDLDELVANYLVVSPADIAFADANMDTDGYYSTSAVSEIVHRNSNYANINGLAELFQGVDSSSTLESIALGAGESPDRADFTSPCDQGFAYESYEGCMFQYEGYIDEGEFVEYDDPVYGYTLSSPVFGSTFVNDDSLWIPEGVFRVEGYTIESDDLSSLYLHTATLSVAESEENYELAAEYFFTELDEYQAPSYMVGESGFEASWNVMGEWNTTLHDSIINNLGTFLVYDVLHSGSGGFSFIELPVGNDDLPVGALSEVNTPIGLSCLGLLFIAIGFRRKI